MTLPSSDRLAILLLAGMAVLFAATVSNYGITWDEDVHDYYGHLVLQYYLSGLTDLSATTWQNLYQYGGGFDLTAQLVNMILPFGRFESRHVLNITVAVAGFIGTWKLARALGGARAGLLSVLLLVTIPDYYGHGFNNPKDVPFAAASVWALYYMVLALPRLPRVPLALAAKLGLAIGLALSVRVGGFLLFFYLGLLLSIAVLLRWRDGQGLRDLMVWSVQAGWRLVLPAVLIGYVVMLGFWPWAQLSPLLNPLRSLAEFSHHAFTMPVLFDGDYYPSNALPWFYLPGHLLIRLPEPTLLLSLFGLALAFARLRLIGRPEARPAALAHGLTAFAVLFPIAYAVAIGAVLFDGMRHFLFVLPPLACLAGAALDRLLGWLPRGGRRAGLASCLAVYAAYHVSLMVRLHPHQYIYYNALVGGIEGAAQRFKLDYWANSYAEAVGELKAHLVARYGRAGFERRRFNVAVCGPTTSAAYYFPGNVHLVADRREADYFIRFEEACREVSGREVAQVERVGVRLSTVLELAGTRQSVGRLPPM